jgi:hypothetical protein
MDNHCIVLILLSKLKFIYPLVHSVKHSARCMNWLVSARLINLDPIEIYAKVVSDALLGLSQSSAVRIWQLSINLPYIITKKAHGKKP